MKEDGPVFIESERAKQDFPQEDLGTLKRLWRLGFWAIMRIVRLVLWIPRKAAGKAERKLRDIYLITTQPMITWLGYCETFYGSAIAQKADIYHVHDLPLLLAGACVAVSAGKPLIYDSHELWLERNKRNKFWHKMGGELQKYLARNFITGAITVNESIARELEKRYDLISPLALRNCSRLVDEKRKSDRIREKLDLAPTSLVGLFHGAFGKLRGLDNLVKSGEYLRESNIYIVLLGRGKEEEYLRELTDKLGVKSNVKFLPFVPENEVLEWVRSADVGLVAYPVSSLNTYLSSPNKLYQYLMAGLPVITVNHPEKRRIVVENGIGPVGIVLDEPEPKKIAEALLLLAKDAELRKEMAENARRLCIAELNWEAEAQKLIDFYKNVFDREERRE